MERESPVPSFRIRPLPLPLDLATYRRLLPDLPETADAEERFAHKLTRMAPGDVCEAFIAEDADAGGVGLAVLGTEGVGPGQAKAFVVVQPPQRRRGIGSALLVALEDAALGQGRVSLQCYALLAEGTLAFARASGWHETRREVVQRVLDAGASGAALLPNGAASVETRVGASLSREEAEAIYGAYADAGPAFAACVPLEDFIGRITQERPFNQVAVAWRDSLCLGMAWGQDAEPDAVFNEFTGVRPAFAGNGIATCLKRLLVQAAWGAGRTHLFTCNSPGNAPILTINHKLGYQAYCALGALEKQIARTGLPSRPHELHQ